MNLIGLDVGFSATRQSSGVARFASGEVSVGCASTSLKSRQQLFGTDEFDIAAIDAPILPRESNFQRACEHLFTLGRFQRRCKPGLSHVPGTGRAFREAGYQSAGHLAPLTSGRKLSAHFPRVCEGVNIVEAFPNAFLGVLLTEGCFDLMPKLRRGQKFEWLYEQCRQQDIFDSVIAATDVVALPAILTCLKSNTNHDQKSALICLLTAAAVASGRYTAVGEPEGGYFFLPPWNLWTGWARQELETQRRRLGSVDVWIDGRGFTARESLPTLQ